MSSHWLPKAKADSERLHDRAVRAGLLVGFLLLILILAGADYLGLSTMTSLRDDALSLATNQWGDVQLATEALDISNKNLSIALQLVNTADQEEIRDLLRRRDENSTRISEILDRLSHRVGSAEEQELFDAVVKARAEYLNSVSPIANSLAQAGNRTHARELLVQTTLPLVSKYQLAWNEYIQFQAREMNEHVTASSASYVAERRRTVQLMVLSVLLAASIATAVLRLILADVRRREAATREIEQLNRQLELKVHERTLALEVANQELTAEIAERKRVEEKLRSESAFLEAQTNSTLNGLLAADCNHRITFRNQRFAKIFGLPQSVFESDDYQATLDYAVTLLKDPQAFLTRINYLNDHPTETGQDEIEFKNGTIVDRYSTPIVGKDGKQYGRFWIFRDITGQKRTEERLLSRTTFLEALTNSISDGLVAVDAQNRILLRNRRFIEMLKLPGRIAANDDNRFTLEYAVSQAKDPRGFLQRVNYIYSHRNEIGRDEVESKDGTIMDRYTSPVVGKDGTYYGRIWIFRDITQRKRNEEAIRRLSLAVEQSPVSIVITDLKGNIIYVNRKFVDCTGYAAEEVIGKNPRILRSGHTPKEEYKKLWETIKSGQEWRGEFHNRKKSGELYWETAVIRPIKNENGVNTHYLAMREDITERKLLQDALHQAQKMEAVGRLAGGVAHDFNNMLGVISGYSELLKLRTDLDPAALHQIDGIHMASKKAASLTQQLLAFSRKQIVMRQVVDLNDVLTKLTKMLRRLIGDDIELTLRLSPGDVRVKVDPNQIDQVLMNLAVNARDAMPKGGKLIIETEICNLDQSHHMGHKPVVPGRYVRLTIADTGCGMDDATMSHLFEPFFTTKEVGRGTGLGLSIVYGIVTQSEGYIWVYSEPGKGSAFKVYLPLQSAEAKEIAPSVPIENLRGSETILLVEDDQGLRTVVAEFLAGLGYSVLEATSGEDAVELAAKANTPPQILVTDIVMPKLDGRELADRLISKLPNLKVVYVSGYTHDGLVQTRALGEGEVFLQKPFSLADLSKKLREVASGQKSLAAHASGRS